jgi:hypothetical protein
MIKKIKDNIGLVATGLALMGTVGAGLSTATELIDKLTTIDERMNEIRVDFEMLKDSTMVQGDIAVLFEKVQKLEIANDVQENGMNYQLEKWEWDQLKEKIIRIETDLINVSEDVRELDVIKDRLAYLEANR